MKEVVGAGVVALTLSFCSVDGGNSSSPPDNGNNPPATNVKVEGIYKGNTNQGQTAISLVDKNNKFWLLYSQPNVSGVTGFLTSNLTVSGNTVNADNGKDFYFGGSTILNASISGTVASENSLNGTITYSSSNQVSFSTAYDPDLNNVASNLATISGTYEGESATLYGINVATLAISNEGLISGKDESGCSFSGNITAENEKPYYNINITFGESPCYTARKSMSGVAYYDFAEKTLYSASENNERSSAFLFFGKKIIKITAFGDSMTIGAGSNGNPYTKFLQTELENHGIKAQIFNSGVGGETSVTIAARQGGTPFQIKFDDGVIPTTTTAVRITLLPINGEPTRPLVQANGEGGAGWQGFMGYIPELGISGTLAMVKPDGQSATWVDSMYYTFKRAEAGSAITVNQQLTFYTNFSEEHRGDIQIIWAGQNGPSNSRSIQDVKAMIQHLNAVDKKYLVISKPTSTDAEDAQWLAEFGPRFVPIRKYMVEHGLQDAGITPTAQDLIDKANGTVPTTFKHDGLHWTPAANEVAGKYIFKILKDLGWV